MNEAAIPRAEQIRIMQSHQRDCLAGAFNMKLQDWFYKEIEKVYENRELCSKLFIRYVRV